MIRRVDQYRRRARTWRNRPDCVSLGEISPTACLKVSGECVTEIDRRFDPVETLTTHAAHLDAICSPERSPKVFYDCMSGALIWSDETNSETPIKLIWALRFIFAYRTSLMLNEPRGEFESMWNLGVSLFPNWIGFRPDRRHATRELMVIYQRGKGGLDEFIEETDRLIEEETDRLIENDDTD